MIKVRLHGTSEEISKYMELMHQVEHVQAIQILSESGLYKDRGKSLYSRLYMDIEVLQIPGNVVDGKSLEAPKKRNK